MKFSLFTLLVLLTISCHKNKAGDPLAGHKIPNAILPDKLCNPGEFLAMVDCTYEIPFSSDASKSATCNNSGNGLVFGTCTLNGCLTSYHMDSNTCVANACNPNQSYGTVSCVDEIPFSASATKSKDCNNTGSDYVYGTCSVSGCLSNYHIDNNACVANTCSPNQSYGTVSCVDEIPYSATATKSKTCDNNGADYVYGTCSVSGCLSNYHIDNNSCAANTCDPNQSYGTVSCVDEIPYSATATKSKTCNGNGSGYIYGSCNVSGCLANYHIDSNSCVANTCDPNQSYGTVSCIDEIPYSETATKTKDCNGLGSDYVYGSCSVTGCSSGYNLQGNSCIANACNPNQSYGTVDCTNEITYSSVATKPKDCNSTGSDYVYGSCTATSCTSGYNLQSNSCIANTCNPNQSYGTVDCTNEITYSSVATKPKDCNSTGSDYVYGSCTATSCTSGYNLQSNSCIANTCTPNQSYGNVSCVNEKPNSVTADKTKTCNSTGSDYVYGSCTVGSCQSGYEINNNACVAINFSIVSGVSITEGDNGTKSMTFTVTLSSAMGSTVSVDYATANGTATAGSDYTAKSGTLSFNSGTLTKTFSVQIKGDENEESNEIFYVNLSNAVGGPVISNGQSVGTIIDNDD